MATLDERRYRELIDEAFGRIDAAFEAVDPDLAEVQLGQGTLTIVFPGNLRCILTPQPPVKQLWMAFRDRAWHFDWNAEARVWRDDRGEGVEVFHKIADITRVSAGVAVEIGATA